jgi:hypothetical protein
VTARKNPGAAKPHAPKVKSEALRLRRTGMAATDIAAKLRKQFGIKLAKATVQRWGDEADAEQAPDSAPASAPAPAEPEAPATDTDAADADDLEMMRSIMREQRTLAGLARKDGNAAAAAKALAAAGKAAEAVARIVEKRGPVGEGGLVRTREQVAQDRQWARDLAAKYREDLERTNGPVCAACGRNIRIALASAPGGKAQE